MAQSCCGEDLKVQLDFSRMDLSYLNIDLRDRNLWLAAANIVFNPIFWNVVARYEYNTRRLTRLCGNNAYFACYTLAACIFSLGLLRDYRFNETLKAQPTLAALENSEAVFYAGAFLVAVGTIFVLSSFYALGITGTFLGDYCGILMDARVTSFPFNVLDNPMYVGSTMIFLGTSLTKASPCGLMLTVLVAVVYKCALAFEGPFTEKIYANRAVSDNQAKPKTL